MKSLIFGTNSQDAHFLTKVLRDAGEEVWGVENSVRMTSKPRVDRSCYDNLIDVNFNSITSLESVLKIPDVTNIYNLVGYSSVHASFIDPIACFESNSMFPQRLLMAMKNSGTDAHLFHCSSSEMYAGFESIVVDENTLLSPISPYGISKSASHYTVNLFRKAFGVRASTGILFNHESELRSYSFFSKKATSSLVDFYEGKTTEIVMGTLDFRRDWSYAGDFAHAFLLIGQQSTPDDFVIASGQLHSGRDFFQVGLSHLGISVEVDDIVRTRSEQVRPLDHKGSIGNSYKIRSQLNWQPSFDFESMVKKLVDSELMLRGLT